MRRLGRSSRRKTAKRNKNFGLEEAKQGSLETQVAGKEKVFCPGRSRSKAEFCAGKQNVKILKVVEVGGEETMLGGRVRILPRMKALLIDRKHGGGAIKDCIGRRRNMGRRKV